MIRLDPMHGAAAFGAPSDHIPAAVEPSAEAKSMAEKYGNALKLEESRYQYGGAYGSNGMRKFKDRYNKFQESECMAEAAAWELNAVAYEDTSLIKFGFAAMPATNGGKKEPIFTALLHKGFAKNVFDDAITPGFKVLPNAQTAFPAAGSNAAASGSLFHALVIPTARIYNAVTLNKERYKLVRTMMDFFDSTNPEHEDRVNMLMNACLESQNTKMKALGKSEEEQYYWTTVYNTMWNKFVASGEELHLGMFFHVHNTDEGKGDHTVGHLHMHVFPLNKHLRTNYEHDNKCCDAETICQFFQHFAAC